MKQQFKPGRRVAHPDGSGSAFLGTLLTRTDEQWLVEWDDGASSQVPVDQSRLLLLAEDQNVMEWFDALLTPRQHRWARIIAALAAVLPISALVSACSLR